MARLTDRNDWFEMWFEDKKCVRDTMIRNMAADLNAGYNYFGNSIIKQRKEIENYQMDIDNTMELFKTMEEKEVNRWCFYDMKKRGIIE